MKSTYILRSVQNAIRFIQASKRSLILLVGWTNSDANTEFRHNQFFNNLNSKKRLIQAFFCIWASFSQQLVVSEVLCETSEFDSLTSVRHIIDGDTFITTDNTHVRLLGIDAPEFDYETNNHDPGAVNARSLLIEYLSEANQIGLVFDKEPKDAYGRILAHVFLTNGTNLQAELIKSGYAVPYTFPPNLMFADCYYAIAQTARNNNRGVWNYSDFQRINASQLKPSDKGFRIITGKIAEIHKSKRSLILELNQNLRIFILNKNLEYFALMNLQDLLGKSIEVYGKIDYRDNVFWLQLRHPYDLKIEPSM